MKILIPEDHFHCRTMFQLGYQQKNTFNIIITSNNNCVTLSQNNNTKYVCLDIDESYIGNYDYFGKVKSATENIHVQRAFYNDMVERYTKLNLDNWSEDKELIWVPGTNYNVGWKNSSGTSVSAAVYAAFLAESIDKTDSKILDQLMSEYKLKVLAELQ
jgi:hypothetical protein